MPKRWIAGGLAAVALWLASALALWPASAIAAGGNGLYARVLHAYQTTGAVPPCQFTSQQLSTALGAVDTYGQQYYADFIAAIQGALASRASGTCSKHHHPSAAAAGQAGPAPPASVTAATSSGVPAPMIVLGVIATLGALIAVLAFLATRPGGSSEWRHGWEEARYRIGLRGGRGRR